MSINDETKSQYGGEGIITNFNNSVDGDKNSVGGQKFPIEINLQDMDPHREATGDHQSDNFTLNSRIRDASEPGATVKGLAPAISANKLGLNRLNKVKLTTIFDHKRMQFMLDITAKINSAKNIADTLLPLLENITTVVNSTSCSFFLF